MASLQATFPRVGGVATLEWDDGLVAEVPILLRHQPMPHDLEHLVVDHHVGWDVAFWPFLADQCPFGSVRPLNRGWGRDHLHRWAARLAETEDGMKEAEATAAPVRTLAHGDHSWAEQREILSKSWPGPTRPNRLSTLTEPEVAAMVADFRRLEARWAATPPDGALVVTWPWEPDD